MPEGKGYGKKSKKKKLKATVFNSRAKRQAAKRDIAKTFQQTPGEKAFSNKLRGMLGLKKK